MKQLLIITILSTLSIAKRIKFNQEYQLIVNDQCYYGTYSQFNKLQHSLGIIMNLQHHQDDNCKPVKHLLEIGELYQYGNWCGKNYGGFNNKCKELCLQNIYEPTEECKACNRPVDWVDEQCMYHDFCVERYDSYGIGYGASCDGTISLGNPFPSPCQCPQNITYNLRANMLVLYCHQDESCLINGAIIFNAFNALLPCSCSYQVCNNNTIDEDGNYIDTGEPLECSNKTACVDVDLCTALNGV